MLKWDGIRTDGGPFSICKEKQAVEGHRPKRWSYVHSLSDQCPSLACDPSKFLRVEALNDSESFGPPGQSSSWLYDMSGPKRPPVKAAISMNVEPPKQRNGRHGEGLVVRSSISYNGTKNLFSEFCGASEDERVTRKWGTFHVFCEPHYPLLLLQSASMSLHHRAVHSLWVGILWASTTKPHATVSNPYIYIHHAVHKIRIVHGTLSIEFKSSHKLKPDGWLRQKPAGLQNIWTVPRKPKISIWCEIPKTSQGLRQLVLDQKPREDVLLSLVALTGMIVVLTKCAFPVETETNSDCLPKFEEIDNFLLVRRI